MSATSLIYGLTPLTAWLVAGFLKFIINSVRARQWAFGQIGYGGMPSNHSSIVSSTTFLIMLREGIGHPAFGVALTFAAIVILDAASLRRQIGRQAQALNRLQALEQRLLNTENQNQPNTNTQTTATESPLPLRERMGHTRMEILGGIVTGSVVAYLLNLAFN